VRPRNEIRVEEMREQFHAFHDSRARPREVRVRIHSIDLYARQSTELPRELD
jgi:hypothetical protein